MIKAINLLVLVIVWTATSRVAKAQDNIIPKPIHAVWGQENLDLSKGIYIKKFNSSLTSEYETLKNIFK